MTEFGYSLTSTTANDEQALAAYRRMIALLISGAAKPTPTHNPETITLTTAMQVPRCRVISGLLFKLPARTSPERTFHPH
jgi:hypothetical protein